MNELNNLQLDNLPNALENTRQKRGFSLKAVSELLGIPTSRLRNYERGKYIPTLPELEILSYLYRVPIFILMDNAKLVKFLDTPEADQIQKLISLRSQIIRTHLQIAFETAEMSQKDLSRETGIPASRIKRYMNKPVEIPLDDLIKLDNALDLDHDVLFDNESPVGKWHNQQELFCEFESLPDDIREFIKKEDNQKTIRAARNINYLNGQHLLQLADSLKELVEIKNNQGYDNN